MTDDTTDPTDDERDDERDAQTKRVCPDCGNPVGKRLREGVYFCRGCMKAVRPLDADDGDTVVPVYRPTDDPPPDEPFTDGGITVVGEIEEIHASPDAKRIMVTAKLTPRGLDFTKVGITVEGTLAVDARDMSRLLDAFDVPNGEIPPGLRKPGMGKEEEPGKWEGEGE